METANTEQQERTTNEYDLDVDEVVRFGKLFIGRYVAHGNHVQQEGYWEGLWVAELIDGTVRRFSGYHLYREDRKCVAAKLRRIRRPSNKTTGPLVVWEKGR